MTEEIEGRQRKLRRLWLALAVLAAILAVLIVPPLLSVSRYKSQITHLISASLGRPVRLSSVEVRLLPRPGFVLTDLTVDEDPAYGAEPVLHANTVTASIRLLSLWRGRMEIDTISVDEASLNLVRTSAGRWNLDPLLRTASGQDGLNKSGKSVKLPYLEATNSRINIKNDAEKLPFSLLDTKLSFWQENPGEWRVRLRGQPARTDLSLQDADTGVVRLEASLRQASELRKMPVHLDLEWRDAQLGQLSRLVLGSDPGWRGDLTGEAHLDGTVETAQVKARLRAAGVHRVEFAPVAPLDFDARCGFVYHYSRRAVENLTCDSPLGNGHIRLSGDLPGDLPGELTGGLPGQRPQTHLLVELDRIPVSAGLDALRTVRSGFAPGLEAKGAASGKITYTATTPENAAPEKTEHSARTRSSNAHSVAPLPAAPHLATQGSLAGLITVDGFELSGDGLSQPIQVPKLVLEPAPALLNQPAGSSQPQALAAAVSFPAGGSGPLAVTARLSLSGYQIAVRGQASIARARELAHVAGLAYFTSLDALAGEPVSVDLAAEGSWMQAQKVSFGVVPLAVGTVLPPVVSPAAADSLTGTVTLRNANWKADYLASHVEISQATLHLGSSELRWDPVVFSYGPLKGTASLSLSAHCDTPEPCAPHFQVQFGVLDASLFQAAFLGARKPGTLLSSLIERLRPSSTPSWPRVEGTAKVDSLILGPVTLRGATATLSIFDNSAEITSLDAGLLGGHLHASGTLHGSGQAQAQNKPSYALEGQFEKLNPQAVGKLIGLRSAGGAFGGNGKLEASGFTAKDLAASAKGALHFEWQRGAVFANSGSGFAPPVLARFDRWTADAEISNGGLTLTQNQVRRGAKTAPVQAAVTFGDSPKVAFAASKETKARR